MADRRWEMGKFEKRKAKRARAQDLSPAWRAVRDNGPYRVTVPGGEPRLGRG